MVILHGAVSRVGGESASQLLGSTGVKNRENVVFQLMTSEGVQRGLEMKDLRDLKDLTIHDVRTMV